MGNTVDVTCDIFIWIKIWILVFEFLPLDDGSCLVSPWAAAAPAAAAAARSAAALAARTDSGSATATTSAAAASSSSPRSPRPLQIKELFHYFQWIFPQINSYFTTLISLGLLSRQLRFVQSQITTKAATIAQIWLAFIRRKGANFTSPIMVHSPLVCEYRLFCPPTISGVCCL